MRNAWGRFAARFLVADPALSRLRMALRTLFSLLLTAVALALFHKYVHSLPIGGFGLGAILAFTGSLMIRDDTATAQLVTRAIAAVTAIASMALAASLSSWPFAVFATFLAVIFAAVYVRRFGKRWFAIGMIGFMAFFMGDYLRPQIGDIPLVAVSAVVALGVTHLVTTVLLNDDPERNFHRALATIDTSIGLILDEVADLMAAGPQRFEADARHLRKRLSRLRDAVLMAEGFIPQDKKGALAADGPGSDLAVALFQLQLFLERFVAASRTVALEREAFDHVHAWRDDTLKAWASSRSCRSEEETASVALLLRLVRSRRRIDELLSASTASPFDALPEGPPRSSEEKLSNTSRSGLVPKELHAPIQVTVAAAIALGIGLLLSPVRWYWAVITAVIVFNNARSRSDTLLRALNRTLGTLVGFLVGTVAAHLFAGHIAASAVAVLLLFSVGIYFVQVSYAVMIFCVTVALALLYSLMGRFTPELLVLRLEETIVGALAGSGVAFFLFADRASTTIETSLRSYIAAFNELLEAAKARIRGEGGQDLLPLSRSLDRAYSDLRETVRPMGGPWKTVTRFGSVREALLLLSGCVHWSRSLAQALKAPLPAEHANSEKLEELASEIEASLETAGELGVRLFQGSGHRDPRLEMGGTSPTLSETDDPIFALQIIAALLRRLVN